MVHGDEMPMQSNNFDSIKAYLNPTFEGLEEVYVQLIEGVLDLTKHSTVILRNTQIPLNTL